LGKRFACRYLSYSTTNKNLTRTEAESLSNAGLSVVCVWETTNDMTLGGFDVGKRHAADAYAQAYQCGAPFQPVIYFAVDFDATVASLRVVGDYFRGVSTVIPLHRIGVYGGFRTVDFLWRNGFVSFLWQTFAWSLYWHDSQGNWSLTRPDDPDATLRVRWHPQCHAQQYKNGVTIDGADCDLDRAVKVDYGQWRIGETVKLNEDVDFWYMMHRVKGIVDNADPIVIPDHPATSYKGRTEPNLLAQAIAAAGGGGAVDPTTLYRLVATDATGADQPEPIVNVGTVTTEG